MKKSKKRKISILILLLLLVGLITYYALFLTKDPNKSISQNITILTTENKVSKKKIVTPLKEENIVITTKYIILGNTDIKRINDDSLIKQVTIYNDIIIVMIQSNNTYLLNIYNQEGNLIKEINSINYKGLYYLTNINNSHYYFNVTGNTITIMGTKLDWSGKYIVDENNHVDICAFNELKDTDIVSATFTFTYNNNTFSKIKYQAVAKYIKDIKKCN